MKKISYIIILVGLLIAIGFLVKYLIEYRTVNLLDQNKIKLSQINKITILSFPRNVKKEITNPDEIKRIYDILKTVKYKKDYDQRGMMADGLFLDIFYNGKTENISFSGGGRISKFSGGVETYYRINVDIPSAIEKMYDWQKLFIEQHPKQKKLSENLK